MVEGKPTPSRTRVRAGMTGRRWRRWRREGEIRSARLPPPSSLPTVPALSRLFGHVVTPFAPLLGNDLEHSRPGAVPCRRGRNLIEEYDGRSLLLCSGSCVCGPSEGIKTLVLSTSLISIPSILYITFPGMALTTLSPAFPVVGAILMVASIFFLYLSASTDPGILPRAVKDDASTTLYFPILHDFEVDGIVHRLKYCSSCHIYRSLRASHCSDCDNCVLDFDHHCPWVGTCIARRNYKWFVLFIYSSTILCLYVFATSIVQLLYANVRIKPADEQGTNVMEDFKFQPMSFILIVYTFLIAWSIGSLAVFHCILMCQGKTTREFIKKSSDSTHTSMSSRCEEVFCTPTPSYIASLIRGCAHDGSDICAADGVYGEFRPFVVLSGNSRLVKEQLQAQGVVQQHITALLDHSGDSGDLKTRSSLDSSDSLRRGLVGSGEGAPDVNGPLGVTVGNAPPLGTFEARTAVVAGSAVPSAGVGPGDEAQMSLGMQAAPGGSNEHTGGWRDGTVRPNRYMVPPANRGEESGDVEVASFPVDTLEMIAVFPAHEMTSPFPDFLPF